MRSDLFWKDIRRTIYNGAYAIWQGQGEHLGGLHDVEDVVSLGLVLFWEKTPPDMDEAHQIRRAWHFGAFGMRNHLRARRGHTNPNNPRNQIPWDRLRDTRAALHTPESPLEARQCLERLQSHLSPEDWAYITCLCTTENQAELARILGVSRSAVSKRLRHLRGRMHLALNDAP